MAMDIRTTLGFQHDIANSGRVDQGNVNNDAAAERAKKVKEQREEARVKQEENRKAVIEEQMKAATLDEAKGRVISESKDGDTVRASEKSMEALNDGIVLAKGSEDLQADENVKADRAAEDAAEKAENDQAAKNNVDNLQGYSKNQIEELYREGKISKQDRDKEIKRREEINEAAGKETAETGAAKKEDTAKATAAQDSAKRTTAESAKDDEDKRAEAAKERQKQANESEERSKKIEAQNENLSNFSADMNNVISAQAKVGQDPDLERFGKVEGFNLTIDDLP